MVWFSAFGVRFLANGGCVMMSVVSSHIMSIVLVLLGVDPILGEGYRS